MLAEGELHHRRRFGPGTVNRGAVLLECEWDGGVFESGALVSGVFRSGEFRGGTFLGGTFLGGEWTGGSWERGYDGTGRYHPRTDHPPHAPSPPERGRGLGRGGASLTIFTSTVYPDVARLWLACVRRSFPDAAVEIFWDSDRPPPDFPVLLRTPERRDYHEAYDDALARCSTPYLAFTDTDVFWTSRDRWPRLRDELERNERLAAISCISRPDRPSHGTFAVFLKTDIYRRLGVTFAPAIENVDPDVPWQKWTHHSSGDLAARAVLEAGYEIRFEEPEGLVRFDGITAPRRIGEHLPLGHLMSAGRYHWVGLLGNRILAGLHDRLFPHRYELTVPASSLLREAPRIGLLNAARFLARYRNGARRIEEFLA
ncbi:MAG TPA: hypothetical protein VFR31_15580 [Thermoanaerobaculia bacterium]|nr:hypothetical protein [Thermoanaerobaculia bacterium]